MNSLTIIMYHYVRPIQGSAYPKIKGLEIEGFKRQLDYLSKDHQFVTAEAVMAAVKGRAALPQNACWLTFDDGYKDHYTYVLPELKKRGIQGAFFPPVKPITERVMLDVNSIHFILATTEDVNALVNELNQECLHHGVSQKELDVFWATYAVPGRYDPKEVIYIKRMLQHALPEALRNTITAILFKRHVGVSQTDFAQELYMSEDELKKMIRQGMYVGSHGYRHLWLNRESSESQKSEILASVEFLNSLGSDTSEWIMCYPFGGHNDTTIALLKEMNCVVGITTDVAKADLATYSAFELPRFDTNDFPQ